MNININFTLMVTKKVSWCPPAASRTATLLTTVSPPSWLITKQLAVSAGAVIWMLTILDCSMCLTRFVS